MSRAGQSGADCRNGEYGTYNQRQQYRSGDDPFEKIIAGTGANAYGHHGLHRRGVRFFCGGNMELFVGHSGQNGSRVSFQVAADIGSQAACKIQGGQHRIVV